MQVPQARVASPARPRALPPHQEMNAVLGGKRKSRCSLSQPARLPEREIKLNGTLRVNHGCRACSWRRCVPQAGASIAAARPEVTPRPLATALPRCVRLFSPFLSSPFLFSPSLLFSLTNQPLRSSSLLPCATACPRRTSSAPLRLLFTSVSITENRNHFQPLLRTLNTSDSCLEIDLLAPRVHSAEWCWCLVTQSST